MEGHYGPFIHWRQNWQDAGNRVFAFPDVPRRVAIGLGLAFLAIVGQIATCHRDEELNEARSAAVEAIAAADSAASLAEAVLDHAATLTGEVRLAEWRADQAEARAEQAEAKAVAADRRADRARARYEALATDSLVPKIEADAAIEAERWSAESWRQAYLDRTEQAAELQTAVDSAEAGRQEAIRALERVQAASASVVAATKRLEAETRPSLLQRLAPKTGVGAAAGLDVLGRPNAVVGVTIGWTVRF